MAVNFPQIRYLHFVFERPCEIVSSSCPSMTITGPDLKGIYIVLARDAGA